MNIQQGIITLSIVFELVRVIVQKKTICVSFSARVQTLEPFQIQLKIKFLIFSTVSIVFALVKYFFF